MSGGPDTDLARLAASLEGLRATSEIDWYRLGDGYLGIRTDLVDFRRRFAARFADCECGAPDPGGSASVEWVLRHSATDERVLASVRGGSLSGVDLALQLYALDGYDLVRGEPGWTLVRPAGAPRPTLAVSAHEVVASTRYPWRRFLANLAVNHVLGLQRHVLFFHGASLAIRGRGVVLLGPKGSGKTTLALALASRGHAFNGDEIAGVDTRSLEVVPVPRAASVREGPAAAAVTEALRRLDPEIETMRDGAPRHRVRVSELFPGAGPARAALAAVLLVGEHRPAPRARELLLRWTDAPRLGALGCSLWGEAPGARVMQLLQLLGRVRCFRLDPGPPEETADFIERMVSPNE